MEELAKYLKALVLFQIQALLDPSEVAKPEFLLSRAGFAHKEIADLLEKNPAAVAKAISRGKAGVKKVKRS